MTQKQENKLREELHQFAINYRVESRESRNACIDAIMTEIEGYINGIPVVECPQCGRKEQDYDGFGVVYCEPPDGCGYCQHLSDSLEDGQWICDYCGTRQVEGESEGEVKHEA